jgi:NitT/TauT family transport system ATP-binding protein
MLRRPGRRHNGAVAGRGGRVRSLVVPPRIELRDVSKSFGTLDALAPVSFDVAEGETVTLLGPSGCGKTTLLRLIAGLEKPTTGQIVVNGMTPSEARRHKQIGFIPQAPALLPWRTVESNARLLLDINRSASPSTPSVSVADLLEEVGLGEFLDAYPHELSGGMQQRVGLVRAFALDAPILLMDEPFAALDEMTRTDMRHLLGRLCEPLGTTVMFVTHSIPEATFLSDRVAVMSPRPGRVAEDLTIDLPHPRTPDIEDTDEFFHVTTRLRSVLSAGMDR